MCVAISSCLSLGQPVCTTNNPKSLNKVRLILFGYKGPLVSRMHHFILVQNKMGIHEIMSQKLLSEAEGVQYRILLNLLNRCY